MNVDEIMKLSLQGALGAVFGAVIGASAQIIAARIQRGSHPSLPTTSIGVKRFFLPALFLLVGLTIGVAYGIQRNTIPVITADDFSNSQFDGSLNPQLWNNHTERFGTAIQKNGILHLTQFGKEEGLWIDTKYRFTMREPVFIEADLMIDANRSNGVIRLDLPVDLSRNEAFIPECLQASDGLAYCHYEFFRNDQTIDEYETPLLLHLDIGSWNTFRIEVTPPEMIFDFYVNGNLIGSHTAAQASLMRDAVGRLAVGTYGDEISGYVDNVRIGKLER